MRCRRLVDCALLLCIGCGNTEPRVVAREPADAGIDAPAPTPARGRVRVVGDIVVTDRGTPLRGALLPLDVAPEIAFDEALLLQVAREAGLNAMHTYVENWQHVTGEREAQLDRLVDLAERAGLYVIVGIGGGPAGDGHPGNGWFDIAKVRSFWSHYGPRYAARTHVIYEIQNNPEIRCEGAFEAATLDMEREAFTLIRTLAPQTHVVVLSASAVLTPETLLGTVTALGAGIDWSNASLGMHALDDCVPPEGFAAVTAQGHALGVPLLGTEFFDDGFAPYVRALEASGVGWLAHSWLTHIRDLATFRQAMDAALITWCPDYGTWPQDSLRCVP